MSRLQIAFRLMLATHVLAALVRIVPKAVWEANPKAIDAVLDIANALSAEGERVVMKGRAP